NGRVEVQRGRLRNRRKVVSDSVLLQNDCPSISNHDLLGSGKTEEPMTERDEEKMVCSNCGAEGTRTIGVYPFKECGLRNVTLIGVNLIECPSCGNVDPIIPDVNDLMRALAWYVSTQRFKLTGEDVRFLRKYL